MEIIFKNELVEWIDLKNPTEEILKELALKYQFQTLTIEDSLEPGHLPKFEFDGRTSFFLFRYYVRDRHSVKNIVREFSHKIGIYIDQDTIITVYQHDTPIIQSVFNQLKLRYAADKISVRHILYFLIDELLSTFEQPALRMDENIDEFEEMIFTEQLQHIKLKNLYLIKREASACKKILEYTKEVLSEYSLTRKQSSTLQDLKEECEKMLHLHSQVMEDTQNLLSIYISLNSQKSNDIMKTLTIFSAFFLPLTFIAGIYGMNFQYMPELAYQWSYPVCLLVMGIISLIIYIWFRKKHFI